MTPKTPPKVLVVEHLKVATLKSNPKNVRRHAAKQITKICRNIQAVGMTNPLVVDEGYMDLRILLLHQEFEIIAASIWDRTDCSVVGTVQCMLSTHEIAERHAI